MAPSLMAGYKTLIYRNQPEGVNSMAHHMVDTWGWEQGRRTNPDCDVGWSCVLG